MKTLFYITLAFLISGCGTFHQRGVSDIGDEIHTVAEYDGVYRVDINPAFVEKNALLGLEYYPRTRKVILVIKDYDYRSIDFIGVKIDGEQSKITNLISNNEGYDVIGSFVKHRFAVDMDLVRDMAMGKHVIIRLSGWSTYTDINFSEACETRHTFWKAFLMVGKFACDTFADFNGKYYNKDQ